METTSQSLNPDDPRFGLAVAVQTTRQIAESIDPSQYGNATPCEEFDVGQLLRHIAHVLDTLAHTGRGEQVDWEIIFDDVIPDGEHDAALEKYAHAAAEAWADPALLGQMFELPWGTMPGAAVIGSYAAETLTHAWDVAAATEQQVAWPSDDVMAPVLAGLEMGLGTDGRDDPDMPFGPVVEIAADAPLIERLVAFSGRDPRAWPSAVA